MAVDLSLDKLVEEMKQLRGEFSRISDSLMSAARRQTGDAAAKVRHAAEDGWSEAVDASAGIAKRIEEQPLAATAIAFGIGMLLGMLLLGRRR